MTKCFECNHNKSAHIPEGCLTDTYDDRCSCLGYVESESEQSSSYKLQFYMGAILNCPKLHAGTYCLDCKKLIDLKTHNKAHGMNAAISIIAPMDLIKEATDFFKTLPQRETPNPPAETMKPFPEKPSGKSEENLR